MSFEHESYLVRDETTTQMCCGSPKVVALFSLEARDEANLDAAMEKEKESKKERKEGRKKGRREHLRGALKQCWIQGRGIECCRSEREKDN